MADEKQTKLSIVVRTVDRATAKIKAINERLDAIAKPVRDFRKALSELREKSGIDGIVTGVKGVGTALSGVLSKVGLVGGALVGAGLAIKAMTEDFDNLGSVAQRFGSSVDFVAQLRYVANRSGASAEKLDGALDSLGKSMGEMRAGGGKMTKFLGTVSPVLLKQVKGTKSNEEAFLLLADAMVKIKDPAKRAVFAAKTLGDASLAQTLGRGSKGIQELRDRYASLAGSQESAVAASSEFGDSMHDFRASMDGVKAALVTGLAPALKVIVDRLRDWFTAHREDIAAWAKNIGEKLPGAIKAVADWIGMAFDKVRSFVDMIGGLKNAAIGVGLVIAGPLIGSIVALSGALLTAIGRAVQLGKALGGAGSAASSGGGLLGKAGQVLAPLAAAKAISDATGGSLIDVARSKGFKSDNILGLFEEARGGLPGTSVSDVTGQIARNLNEISTRASEARVTVDFANAPKGTRVSTDPRNSADVDLSVGYQMIPGSL